MEKTLAEIQGLEYTPRVYWFRTKKIEPWKKNLVRAPIILFGFLVKDEAINP
jgi:hypothetical protein